VKISVSSVAKLSINLFQPESGKAPIESIMPEVIRMPLYKLINDPFGTIWGLENVKKNVKMADFKPHEYLAA
jgi:hypothetical protein